MSQGEDVTSGPTQRKLAVLIGIDRYRGDIPCLTTAVHDVESVGQVLRELHGYEVRLITNDQAALQDLRQLLADLPSQVAAEDRLFFYFAGHGVADSEGSAAAHGAPPRGYLIPVDAQRDRPDSFLPMAELQACIDRLLCRHVLLCLDCCFAGAFRWTVTRDLRVRRQTLYRERYERYLRDPARQVLVSAAADERALDVVAGRVFGQREVGAQSSPFAAAVCEALRGQADLRVGGALGDGIIVSSELHLYVEESMKRLEEQSGRPLQRPLLWSLPGYDKGEYVFTVAGRGTELPSAVELSEQNNPYRGLAAFDESSHKLFFGRTALVDELLRQVQAEPLTVVIGSSGTGKSSIVCAGLVPRLRERAASGWLLPAPVRPGRRPLAALATLCAELGVPETPLDLAISCLCQREPQRRILLVVDQLEELITVIERPEERERFLDLLDRAIAASHGALHIVATLRADFEPHLAAWLGRRGNCRFLIRPMNRQELREAIELPASERVLYFDPPSVVERIVDEVVEMPGALPLLSFTLCEMYRAYVRSARDNRTLTAADYDRLGQVAGALSKRADDIYHELDLDHQATLRRVMLRMVALEGGEVARRHVALVELNHGAEHPEQPRVERVVKSLLDARLIVAGRDAEGESYVEPAHDKLVLGWQPLWTFLRQERDNLPLLRRLTQAATDWERGGRQHARLWSQDPRLPQVVALQHQERARFSLLESEFIGRSEARRRRRLLGSAGLIAGVILVLIALTIYAFRARDRALLAQRHEQEQRALAEQRLNDALAVAETLVFTVDRKLEPVSGTAAVRRELLDQSEQLLEKLLRNGQVRRRALRAEETRLLQEADLLMTQGATHAAALTAKRQIEAALSIAERLALAAPADPDSLAERAEIHARLARASTDLDERAAAMQQGQQAAALFEQAIAAVPTNRLWRLALARIYGAMHEQRVRITSDAGAQSAPQIAQAISILADVCRAEPAGAELQGAWVEAYASVCEPFGATAVLLQQTENGLRCHTVGLAGGQWLQQKAPQRLELHSRLGRVVSSLRLAVLASSKELRSRGGELAASGRVAEAVLALTQAIAAADSIGPSDSYAIEDKLESLIALGMLRQKTGAREEAIRLLNQALSTAVASADMDSGRRFPALDAAARAAASLAAIHQADGQLQQAQTALARSIEARSRLVEDAPREASRIYALAQAQLPLAGLLAQSGQKAAGLDWCERAASHLKEVADKNPHWPDLREERYVCERMCARLAREAGSPRAETEHGQAAAAIARALRLNITDAGIQRHLAIYTSIFGQAP